MKVDPAPISDLSADAGLWEELHAMKTLLNASAGKAKKRRRICSINGTSFEELVAMMEELSRRKRSRVQNRIEQISCLYGYSTRKDTLLNGPLSLSRTAALLSFVVFKISLN